MRSAPGVPPGRWPGGSRPPRCASHGPGRSSRVSFISVMGDPVSTPRCTFSVRWVRMSRCQLRSSTSSGQAVSELKAAAPLAAAPAAGGPPRSGAGAQSVPPPPPERRWSPCRRCSPAPKVTSRPKRSWMSRVSTERWISPMSRTCSSPRVSFHSTFSWGSSSSSWRRSRSRVCASHPSGGMT